MRELVAAVAGPRTWSDTRESWLNRAARLAGISFRQVRAIFYGEITDPKHRSVQLMRHAAERRAAKQRAAALAHRFETLAQSMDAADADFYRKDVLALIDAARALRGLDRPGDDQD